MAKVQDEDIELQREQQKFNSLQDELDFKQNKLENLWEKYQMAAGEL